MKNYEEAFENELKQFLFLCGKKDEKILLSQNKKTLRDDDVRLAGLSLIFDYKKIFLKIAAIAENYTDDFLKKLDGVSFAQLCEWTTEFIDNIEDPDARELAREFWKERKETLDEKNFNFSQLFNGQ